MVGQLASGVAHNFNNIIGAILGYSEMAATVIEADAKAALHLADPTGSGTRPRPHRQHPDLRAGVGRAHQSRRWALDETASLLRATLPPGVELVVSDAPTDLAVVGEAAQVQQIILNLCKNAAQAMEGSGRICIMADAQELDQPRALSHGELLSGRYVRLVVTDNGPGFNEVVADDFSSRFSRPVLAGRALASEPSARSFATMTAQ